MRTVYSQYIESQDGLKNAIPSTFLSRGWTPVLLSIERTRLSTKRGVCKPIGCDSTLLKIWVDPLKRGKQEQMELKTRERARARYSCRKTMQPVRLRMWRPVSSRSPSHRVRADGAEVCATRLRLW